MSIKARITLKRFQQKTWYRHADWGKSSFFSLRIKKENDIFQ